MNTKTIAKAVGGLKGEIQIPGDKSISHRSVMFSALGSTPVHITNFLHAQDCMSTAACMQALGAKVEFLSDTELIVTGNGLHGLKEPDTIIDAGNSGTTLRLMMGILAPQPFLTTFTGDASLHKRPMGRVIKPLSQMGAEIFGRQQNQKLPITIVPVEGKLKGMTYNSPVASAQVKSAILLAGMYAEGDTTVVEPFTSRDHTERMLEGFGVHTEKNGTAVTIHPVKEFCAPKEIEVPGDISSAAYWLVAGVIIPGSDLMLRNVGVNPTRTGILDVLKDMGADIELVNERTSGGEAAADIRVRYSKLHGTEFGAEIMPRLIDEIPVIAVAALFAEGDTIITGAGELRVKETDRLQAITDQFNKLAPGAVEGQEDGLIIHGSQKIESATAFSYDDHRIAMSLAILGAAGQGVTIEKPGCVNISYPTFYQTLEELR
ncbi:3-phosphoshikimate 1-carboxyvinyltransferase [Selenomonas sp. GACV-9]|uniref:3-phosphoshikimate 1-carboxyvinyltransferase n=1 Tax=Selenomonas sp. GACV-9 TaxID=3158782 RepID=UPI0008EB7B98|nr:3-phosphoshikimate 1-carboxyvinyltransferase [Selenomonas ruminantium]